MSIPNVGIYRSSRSGFRNAAFLTLFKVGVRVWLQVAAAARSLLVGWKRSQPAAHKRANGGASFWSQRAGTKHQTSTNGAAITSLSLSGGWCKMCDRQWWASW